MWLRLCWMAAPGSCRARINLEKTEGWGMNIDPTPICCASIETPKIFEPEVTGCVLPRGRLQLFSLRLLSALPNLLRHGCLCRRHRVPDSAARRIQAEKPLSTKRY